MRRLITRGRLRACCVALAGLALMGLIVLTALQPAPQSARARVDALAVAGDLTSASAAAASTAASPTDASTAASPTDASSPPARPASIADLTFGGALVVLSPVTVSIPSPAPTPSPTPAPPQPAPAAPVAPSYSQAEVEAILTAAAQAAGVSPSWLISTAQCESNLNPNADNPSGPYEGILQFLPSTFRAHGGTDIWDPSQQAQIAATMFASGESGEWPVCSR